MRPAASALTTDLYQLTMMQGYFRAGRHQEEAVFDLFYRRNPWENGFALFAGLEQAVEYLLNLQFTADDLDYLRGLGLFDEDFLAYLRQVRFTGEVWAVPEGTVVFPNEPLLRVKAPLGVAQLVETALLTIVNHQTLIATKAARVVTAAAGDPVMEFGLRRAHGPDAGLYGARAAFIGGCVATSNVAAGQRFGVPVRGTMGHSWVMSFPSELEAFRAYARAFPDQCLLLVDTYDTLRSGVPHAIQIARELAAQGHRLAGIRLDSGDVTYLSREARRLLDEAGFPDAKIVASNDLDEEIIQDLKVQGARVDMWGVGTKLITAAGWSALGGVYKMVALAGPDGRLEPKLKLSESAEKTTNPGYKKLFRFYDTASGKALADLIALEGEEIDPRRPITLFDPVETWKRKTLRHFTLRELLVPVVRDGRPVYDFPSLPAIQAYARQELETLWPEYRRLKHPQRYHVDLSLPLWELKERMIREAKAAINGNGHGHGHEPDHGPKGTS